MAFLHPIRPRYGEIDMQGVVFNAHYLAYCDDACESWFASLFGAAAHDEWDYALKRADLVWHGPVRLGEWLEIEVTPTRIGTTSFEVGFVGTVDGRAAFDATITYVCIHRGTSDPRPVPDELRSRLDVG